MKKHRQIENHLGDEVWFQLQDKLEYTLGGQLRNQLWNQLWSKSRVQLADQVWSQLEKYRDMDYNEND